MKATTRGGQAQRGNESRSMPRGDVRAGSLRPIPVLLAEHGLDPARVLNRVGLRPQLFDDPNNLVSFPALGHLLQTCVELTQCQHFGLMVGERFTLDSLGILGQLMRNSPTLRDALRLAIQHLELHDRGSCPDPRLWQFAGGARLLALRWRDAGCGSDPRWIDCHPLPNFSRAVRPVVETTDGPVVPSSAKEHQTTPAILRSEPRILTPDSSAVVFDARWLDHPIAGADPAAYSAIIDTIKSMEARERAPFANEVRRAIHAMLFSASASTVSFANLFNLHERTLRRRLEAEGETVRNLVSEVRQEIADHLLRDTTLPVSEIAAVLRYSDTTVFSRAFRSRSHMSPSEWRLQHAAARVT